MAEKLDKLKIGKFNFYSEEQTNISDNSGTVKQRYYLVKHYLVTDDKKTYEFGASYWYPTGNCQLFSFVYMNQFINVLEGIEATQEDVLSVLKYVYHMNCKRMCFIDINQNLKKQFHKFFDEFIEWINEADYVSTNNSLMCTMTVKFKTIITKQ